MRIGFLNEYPAGIIDVAYLNEPKGFLGKVWSFIKIRAIYTAVFLPLTLVDLITSGFAAMVYGFPMGYGFLPILSISESTSKKFRTYSTSLSRSFNALALSLFGLISPKLIAFHFLPSKKKVGQESGGGFYKNEFAKIEKPKTMNDVSEIVKSAVENKQEVIPVGAGMSQGKQFIPEAEKAVVVDLSNMKEVGEVEESPDGKTITVEAGATWADVQAKVHRAGCALSVMQASNVFSVGGSIGTNIHGWNHQMGMLSNAIVEMTIVDAEGDTIRLNPSDDLFHKVTGGFGLFGIVTSVTLKLVDNENLLEVNKKIGIQDYISSFKKDVLEDQDIRMHLFRLSLDREKPLLGDGTGISVNYKVDRNPDRSEPGREPQDFTEGGAPRGSRLDQVLVNVARRLGWVREWYWSYESNRLLESSGSETTTNKVMKPPIRAMLNDSVSEAEWLQEFFLPEENLEEFINDLSALLKKNNVPLINASVRYVKENKISSFSYAKEGDRFAVVLCFNQSYNQEQVIKAGQWIREAQKISVNRGGTFYLPYQNLVDNSTFDSAYGESLKEVVEQKKRLDPNNIFSSGFYTKYVQKEKNNFQKLMEDSDAKESFKGFLNNILKRFEADALYNLLDEILIYKDTYEEVYIELCKRLPEIFPSTVFDLRNKLGSLKEIQGDLGEQAFHLLPEKMKADGIDGLVEIGYPGRFIGGFKKKFDVRGHIVALNDQDQSPADYIQSGYPAPFHEFQKLNYNDPSNPAYGLSQLKDNSSEVVTCYVGLHHFSEENLDKFLKQVSRVLKDGGSFLLVDHDIDNDETLLMAHMAHSVFNAVYGVSLKEEMEEIRKFRPMIEWKRILEEHDLSMGEISNDNIRNGDPTKNRMVCFTKNLRLEKTLKKGDAGVPDELVLTHRKLMVVSFNEVANTPILEKAESREAALVLGDPTEEVGSVEKNTCTIL